MDAEEKSDEVVARFRAMSDETLDLIIRLVERNSDDLKAVTDAIQSRLERENLELRAELRLIKRRVNFLATRDYAPNPILFVQALECDARTIEEEIADMGKLEA